MSDTTSLVERIRAEFSASQEKLKSYQQEQVAAHHARKERLERLEETFDRLQEVWGPRLDTLVQEFGDRVEAIPKLTPGRRQGTLRFKSPLATVSLRFAATTDDEVRKLVLTYDLDILPILMQYERHAEISFPLDKVDPEAIGKWLDDRIVAFVKIYLAMFENPYYQKDQMVSDPVAKVSFPKFAAATTRERGKETYYFISEETASEFDTGTKSQDA